MPKPTQIMVDYDVEFYRGRPVGYWNVRFAFCQL